MHQCSRNECNGACAVVVQLLLLFFRFGTGFILQMRVGFSSSPVRDSSSNPAFAAIDVEIG